MFYIYLSDISYTKKEKRAKPNSTFFFLRIDYGCIRGIAVGHAQWRVPLAIQLVPGFILCVGMIFLPESLRWYASRGEYDKVLSTLSKLRDMPEDHPEVQAEYEEIQQASEVEKAGKSGRFSDLFHGHNLHRLIIGIMLQVFQQWTGTNAIVRYTKNSLGNFIHLINFIIH
jgi:hypothetical protein